MDNMMLGGNLTPEQKNEIEQVIDSIPHEPDSSSYNPKDSRISNLTVAHIWYGMASQTGVTSPEWKVRFLKQYVEAVQSNRVDGKRDSALFRSIEKMFNKHEFIYATAEDVTRPLINKEDPQIAPEVATLVKDFVMSGAGDLSITSTDHEEDSSISPKASCLLM
ncbi:hypothetical protein [Piscirickettsia salmonis]|nr:hypothetical protein [Piscirickettsia salmonis]QHS27535.1 hypothetical protein GW538_16595 [Piscirickettsia salmonis]QHS30903.1 hypothetical protein GW537_17925 [Piscirickettsia salmonis]